MYHAGMQEYQNVIPISRTPDWKNRCPGTAAFVETFDTEDGADESADVLSFQSLREAFVTLRSAETELAKTIPEIELSEEPAPEVPERPDYGMDAGAIAADLEGEEKLLSAGMDYPAVLNVRLETVIEAMLFVGNQENRPLAAGQIAEKLRNVSAGEVDQAVVYLNKHYLERNCPYSIVSEHGGYRMVLRPEFEPVRSNSLRKVRKVRLPQQAIDTLAVVTYRQPVTAEEVQNLRQRPCAAVLNQLVRRNLLKIVREVRDKKPVVCYRTTPQFLELLKIKSLGDIPKADELDYRS